MSTSEINSLKQGQKIYGQQGFCREHCMSAQTCECCTENTLVCVQGQITKRFCALPRCNF